MILIRCILVSVLACGVTQTAVAHPLVAQDAGYSCSSYAHAPKPPHVLHIKGTHGELVYVGILHATDPRSPGIVAIEREWKRFRPTKVFSEGGVWPLSDSRQTAISKYGEGGLLRFLAEKDAIPIASLEPSAADETAALSREFDAVQLKLFYVLRQVQQYARMHREPAPDTYIQSVIEDTSRARGLHGKPTNLAELEDAVAHYYPKLTDWRRVPESWFYPFSTEHITNVISCQSSLFRDRYIVQLLAAEVNRGGHVFAVIGVGHLGTQEQLLKVAITRKTREAGMRKGQ